MAKIEIKVDGEENLRRFLDKRADATTEAVGDALAASAAFLQAEVEASIRGQRAEPRSVDTGKFLRSVRVAVTNDAATISSFADHALALEYGTSRLPARSHFRNTLARNFSEVVDVFKDEVKDANPR